MQHIESRIQQACVKWFRLQYPHLWQLLFAVPNGGKRDGLQGVILQREGVVAGVSDLILLVPSKGYHGLCIEMKTQTGTHRQRQVEWQHEVERVGYRYVLCRSIESFIAQVNDYLKAE